MLQHMLLEKGVQAGREIGKVSQAWAQARGKGMQTERSV